MRRHPETFSTRAAAVRALWDLAIEGKAETMHDDRFRALVLLAAFASLCWGEVTALKRRDIDRLACTSMIFGIPARRSPPTWVSRSGA